MPLDGDPRAPRRAGVSTAFETDGTAADSGAAGARLREWYASLVGQSTLDEVNAALGGLLRRTYGYHALQIGLFAQDTEVLSRSDLIHPVLQDVEPWHAKVGMIADPAALPLAARSVDLVLLMHALDLSEDPYQVLREADRVLSDDGYLIVVGFNRRSLWGLARLMLRWRHRPPWNAPFYSLARVQDWLGVLGYRTVQRSSVYFRPPIQHAGTLRRLRRLEAMRWAFPLGGAVYLLKARKQTIPLTLIRSRWLPRRSVVGGGRGRPTSRVGPPAHE